MSTTNNPNSPTTDANFIINSNHIHYEMIGNDNSVNYINNLNSTGIADFNIINVNDNLVASHKLNQQTIIQNNFFSACHQNSSASDIYALIIVPAQHHQQPIESINNDNDISIISQNHQFQIQQLQLHQQQPNKFFHHDHIPQVHQNHQLITRNSTPNFHSTIDSNKINNGNNNSINYPLPSSALLKPPNQVPRKGHTRKRSLSAPTIPSEMQDSLPSKPPMSSEEYRHKLNEELEKVDFSDITVSELKNLLRQRNKPATGKKAILMQRLQEEVTLFNNNYGFINHQISNKNSLSSMDDGNDDSQMMMSNDPNDPTSPVSTASLLLNDPLRMFVSSPLQHFYNEEEAFQFIFNQNQQQQISQDDGNMMNIKTEGYFTTPYTLTQQVEDIVMVGGMV
nr:7087_t:CDS:2 [Entrophospora candida]